MNSVQVLSSKLFIQKLIMISGVFLFTIGFQTASAQTKYKTWTDPNALASSTSQQSSGDLQKLVDELNKAVNEADRARG